MMRLIGKWGVEIWGAPIVEMSDPKLEPVEKLAASALQYRFGRKKT